MPKTAVLEGLLKLLSISTFVVHPQLISLLSTPDLASAKPGFLGRLIHAEATTVRIPLVTFEKAASRLAGSLVLKGEENDEG